MCLRKENYCYKSNHVNQLNGSYAEQWVKKNIGYDKLVVE